jgi:hypothetical protein
MNEKAKLNEESNKLMKKGVMKDRKQINKI